MDRETIVAAALLVVVGASAIHPGRAAESSVMGVPPNELASWEKSLRKAGASQAEIVGFEEMLRGIPATELPEAEKYLNNTPMFFRPYLASVRDEQRERAPDALFPNISPIRTCESLREVSLPDSTIAAAAIAPKDGSCRITVTVIHPPAHNPIEVFVGLPVKGWNGRFRGTGGGGYAGGSKDSLNAPVRKGYAVGATDTGNPAGTADFALDRLGKPAWERMRDNAYRGIHDMTVVGKALIEAFYGRVPRYSYFVGGSTGGRQALTEAQRYPQDYDGILALYPAIARDRYVPAQLWPQILMNEAHDFLPRAKLVAATAAAVKACGGTDGVIDDPTQCRYDPAALIGSKVGNDTFTATDAQVIRGMWEGPRAHDGGFLWWGPTRGTDLSNFADTAGTPPAGKPCEEGLDWFRYFLVLDPKWDWTTLTRDRFELLFEQSIQVHSNTYGGDDPDLTGFHDRGGKLLIVHGWADQFVPAQKSVAYYRAVQERMGGIRPTAEFVRLFLVPGGDHGFSGTSPAPATVSNAALIALIVNWVERNGAPENIVAEFYDDHGKILRTRSLSSYVSQR
jgi:hypothetical protein